MQPLQRRNGLHGREAFQALRLDGLEKNKASQVDFAKRGAKIFCERIPEFAKRGD